MRLRLTLRRAGASGSLTNISVTADATATAADVADTLAVADPQPSGAPAGPGKLTLRVVDHSGQGQTLDPATSLLESGVRSGSVVELALPVVAGAGGQEAVAVLRVLSGPDAGMEVALPHGSCELGRSPDARVRLTDPLVSKRHARINISDGVEVIDTNSANGVIVGDVKVGRVRVGPDDVVTVGGTKLSIAHIRPTTGVDSTSTDIPFVRSPRVVPRVPERTVELPQAPRSAAKPRFPYLAMVAPLVMGITMYAFTRSPLSLIFVALSPIIMIGNYIDQRVQAKKKLSDEIVIFDADLITAEQDLREDHKDERAALLAAHPSVAEVADSAGRLGALLWSRRPEHPEFLQLRLGLGTIPARVEIENRRGGGLPEYQERANQLAARYVLLKDAPVVTDLRSVGSLGLCGAPHELAGVARAVVLQLIGLHSPSEVVLACLTSPKGMARWSWLEWLPHTASPHSPLPGSHLSADPGTGMVLLR